MNTPTSKAAKASLLAPDLEVIGDITSKGPLVVQARVVGNIAGDSVTIEHWANVKGDIEAKQAVIEGVVVGAVIASDVRVAHSGQINGSVHYAKLAVETGAVIEGHLRKITSTPDIVPLGTAPEE
jgi:cytoskeletal protein CcmA (bactofilin family)